LESAPTALLQPEEHQGPARLRFDAAGEDTGRNAGGFERGTAGFGASVPALTLAERSEVCSFDAGSHVLSAPRFEEKPPEILLFGHSGHSYSDSGAFIAGVGWMVGHDFKEFVCVEPLNLLHFFLALSEFSSEILFRFIPILLEFGDDSIAFSLA